MTAITMTDDEAEQSLRDYLTTIRTLTDAQAATHPTRRLVSVEAMLLARGQWWARPVEPRPADLRKLPDKQCFWNAAAIARRRARRGYNYVEGFALSDIGFPCHHAWVVDDENAVVETTWRNAGHVYCGLVIPPALVREVELPVLYNRQLPISSPEFWARIEVLR